MSKRNTISQKDEHSAMAFAGLGNDSVNWEELRYFAAVADKRSYRAATVELGVTVNSVRKKIQDLEHRLKTNLLSPSPRGVQLTPDGEVVYSIVNGMRQSAEAITGLTENRNSNYEGIVRVSVTEGLGAFWLMPQLGKFNALHPGIRLDLRCDLTTPDLSRIDSDIAIQLEKPENDDLIVKKIATLHLLLYASEDYVKQYGAPSKLSDLVNHNFIHLVAEQIPSHLLEEKIKTDPNFRFVKQLTNSSSAQAMAISEGACIGVLPTYASALFSNLIPIKTEFHLARPIWVAYHPKSLHNNHRVRKVLDFMIDAFSPRKYFWFKDRFIFPSTKELNSSVTDLYRGRVVN